MMGAAVNSNSSLIPSARDLLLVVPRLAQRAGSLAWHMPEAMDSIAGKIWNGGSVIADATGKQTANSTITNTSAFVQSTAAVLDAAVRESWQVYAVDDTTSVFALMVQGVGRLKNFGGILTYLTSKWALATFTAAIILNRTQFYASSREHLRLRWYMLLGLYMIPMVAFLTQMHIVLQALRCQTSPDFALLRYGDPLKNIAIDFAGEGGFLYRLSSTLLFWEDDATCCAARNMSLVALDSNKQEVRGSMSLLFWFFLTLCTSQLFETLCCALQGKQPMPETGMTIFEHSLAFAECEAMISSALGFGLFGLPKLDSGGEVTGNVLSRSEILQRLNVPPEVLLVCLISCFSHLSSATLAVTGLRHKVRLVNTAVGACCYMSAFIWSFAKIFMRPVENVSDLGVLRFPTVCIIGFIPHMLILVGILICGFIYGVALVITTMSVPEDVAEGMTFRQRVAWAYENLQANVQFSSASSIRIKMSEDFYTALLKVGFNVLTAASEAVYLNEGSKIKVAQMTWLEQKRIDEMASSIEKRKSTVVPSELLGEGIARGVAFTDSQNVAISQSPYARERQSKLVNGQAERHQVGELDTGLGLNQRRSRMHLTVDYLGGICRLFIGIQAHFVLRTLDRLGIAHRSAWLLKAAGITEGQRRHSQQAAVPKEEKRYFWMLDANGRLMLPQDDDVDVWHETRRRLQRAGNWVSEDALSEHLYDWWRGGGWFGIADNSGEYQQRESDDDVTSMISTSTNACTTEEDEDDSGRWTPTQRDPFDGREGTPAEEGTLDMTVLSQLLNPQSQAEREEARLLSYSLVSSRPMTRSQYRREADRSRAQLLSGHRGFAEQTTSEEEEERDLEQFILGQRKKGKAKATRNGTWESGAEGMGAGGPQCVVCQSTSRTILVWPCGCLSMCNDCRVGLAARNHTKCICCRTDIAAYSRLYVP